MLYISHRGNLDGPNPSQENHPDYITAAVKAGFIVEVDVWAKRQNGWYEIWLGHDSIQYESDLRFLRDLGESVIVHCKNREALNLINREFRTYDYFWHHADVATFTKQGLLWAYPDKVLLQRSIVLLPEIVENSMEAIYNSIPVGICSDYIRKYKEDYESYCLSKL